MIRDALASWFNRSQRLAVNQRRELPRSAAGAFAAGTLATLARTFARSAFGSSLGRRRRFFHRCSFAARGRLGRRTFFGGRSFFGATAGGETGQTCSGGQDEQLVLKTRVHVLSSDEASFREQPHAVRLLIFATMCEHLATSGKPGPQRPVLCHTRLGLGRYLRKHHSVRLRSNAQLRPGGPSCDSNEQCSLPMPYWVRWNWIRT